jgi:phospholipid/cholesterol/gamma-HCH transport system substrate-binding protein
MAAPTNHTKLGLFVVLGVAAAIVTGLFLGYRSMHHETIAYYTFFNESVQGLELGSPVKFRGVTIGTVDAIEIAPDHRHVQVKNNLVVGDIQRLGLTSEQEGRKKNFVVPLEMRAQLGSQGITGVKFVAIDFFDAKANPPPELPFPPPKNYIPAAASLMKNLEDTVTRAMERLPEIADATTAVMNRIDRMVAVLEKEDTMGTTAAAMRHADEVLTDLDKTVKKLDQANLPDKAGNTLTDLKVAIGKMNKVLDRIDGETGLVAATQRSIANFGEAGRSATGATKDMEETLRSVREAAESIRELSNALDRDPDMLLKGRAHKKGEKQ